MSHTGQQRSQDTSPRSPQSRGQRRGDRRVAAAPPTPMPMQAMPPTPSSAASAAPVPIQGHVPAPAAFGVPVPEAILRSPLVAYGGFGVYAGLPDAAVCGQLLSEALQAYPHATPQESWTADEEEVRGGTPPRRFLSSSAGAVQDAMYESPVMHGMLSEICGLRIVPSGNRGSYSYYARPGDFLEVHRDIETCDVALITALHDNSPPEDAGGALMLYPGRIGEPLSAIRARPHDGYSLVKLAPGQSIVLFGGIVPHRVLPVAAGQVRIISVLCFKAEVPA